MQPRRRGDTGPADVQVRRRLPALGLLLLLGARIWIDAARNWRAEGEADSALAALPAEKARS